MEFNEIKGALINCADLAALDDSSRGVLLLRGEYQRLPAGKVIYDQAAPLDDSFGLLLSGALNVENGMKLISQIQEQRIFGEMAYFAKRKERTATVRVFSPVAEILLFRMSLEDLASEPFSNLRKYLGLKAWERFVSGSKSKP
jgi:hypothetical protein